LDLEVYTPVARPRSVAQAKAHAREGKGHRQ
jgi:hypothetical protein